MDSDLITESESHFRVAVTDCERLTFRCIAVAGASQNIAGIKLTCGSVGK